MLLAAFEAAVGVVAADSARLEVRGCFKFIEDRELPSKAELRAADDEKLSDYWY